MSLGQNPPFPIDFARGPQCSAIALPVKVIFKLCI